MCSLLKWDVPVLPASDGPVKGGYETAAHIHGSDELGGLFLSENKKDARFHGRLAFVLLSDDLRGRMRRLYYVRTAHQSCYATHPLSGRKAASRNSRRHGRRDRHGQCASLCRIQHFLRSSKRCAGSAGNKRPCSCPAQYDKRRCVHFASDRGDRTAGYCSCPRHAKILTANYHACVRYGESGSTMHDSTAVLYYLFPELFTVRQCGIDVNCSDKPGRTSVTDVRHNVTLTKETDAPLLLQKIMACVKGESTPRG